MCISHLYGDILKVSVHNTCIFIPYLIVRQYGIAMLHANPSNATNDSRRNFDRFRGVGRVREVEESEPLLADQKCRNSSAPITHV